jgi:hypothetical protein
VVSIRVVPNRSHAWNVATIERVANEERIARLKKEKEDDEAQRSSGTAIVKRLAGNPGHVQHDVATKVFRPPYHHHSL